VHAKARVPSACHRTRPDDKQLLDLSQAGEAQLVQVILPPADCGNSSGHE
jgi:hypothetical protein